VLHRGPHALYLAPDGAPGGCVGVVSRRSAQVPCALRVPQDTLGALADARTARVEDGTLVLDGTGLRVGRTVTVRAPALAVTDPAGLAGRLRDDAAGATALLAPDPLPRHALDLLAAGDPAAVPLLVGRGAGLTPLGDDVLCGWLAAREATGTAVPGVTASVLAGRTATTALSAELLDCAVRGEVLPEYAAWLAAVVAGRETAGSRAGLAAVGHTSGAGLLLGGVLALAPTALPHTLDERLTA
jgi:hypothetical protein